MVRLRVFWCLLSKRPPPSIRRHRSLFFRSEGQITSLHVKLFFQDRDIDAGARHLALDPYPVA